MYDCVITDACSNFFIRSDFSQIIQLLNFCKIDSWYDKLIDTPKRECRIPIISLDDLFPETHNRNRAVLDMPRNKMSTQITAQIKTYIYNSDGDSLEGK